MATPLTAVHLDVVSSTQDEARQRFAGRPVLVSAATQTAGRGRTGAGWETAPRALAVSLAWRPTWPAEAVARLTLVSALAALDGFGGDVGVKWPNDLMVGDRKVGGILTERSGDVVVTGLGANLYWPQPPPGYGALHETDPGAAAAAHLAEAWGVRVLERAGAGPDEWGRSEYRARCLTIGRRIAWEPDGEGVAVGIAPGGGLIVVTGAGEVVLESGAVRVVWSAEH